MLSAFTTADIYDLLTSVSVYIVFKYGK